jgi:hypothetical protein
MHNNWGAIADNQDLSECQEVFDTAGDFAVGLMSRNVGQTAIAESGGLGKRPQSALILSD